jgi:hypothetical protein
MGVPDLSAGGDGTDDEKVVRLYSFDSREAKTKTLPAVVLRYES